MLFISRYIAGFVMLALLLGCEDPVNLDLRDTPAELVVVSKFSPGQPVVVQVSRTRTPLSTEDSLDVDNATVELYQEYRLLEVLELVPGNDKIAPYYTTRVFTPAINIPYTIKVKAPDYKEVTAMSSIPVQTEIRALQLSNLAVTPISGSRLNYQYNVSITFEDPVEQQNFYHLNFYQQILEYRLINNDTIITREGLQRIQFSSEVNDNSLTAYFQGGVLLEDKFINGNQVSYSFPLQVNIDPRRELIGKMFAELRSVSEEYYLFHNSLSRQQTSSNGPLNEPVIIYDNIENGQGIFAGYNTALDSVVIRR
ncbi:MAG: DUF4249 domain-containing protein [Saprospiraceae bacterium]